MPAAPGPAVVPAVATPDEHAEIGRLFELAGDLLAVADGRGHFTVVNPAWEATLGWTPEELLATPIFDLVHPDDAERTRALASLPRRGETEITNFANRYRHRDGSWRWLLWSARWHGDTWYAVAKDVTAQKQLERQAMHDALTGLPNRLVFLDRVRQALAALRRTEGRVAVMFVDLDHFKVVNDSFGHHTGDRALLEIAQRLESSLRAGDTLARIGGDEFVILVDGLSDDLQAVDVARRALGALAAPLLLDGAAIGLSASIGIAVTGDPSRDGEDLVREADTAMYRAKARGSGAFEVFDQAMRDEVRARLRVENELRHALVAEELCVHDQPVVALADEALVGCEALVRWQHPERGLPGAGEFVALAEANGLVVPMGAWVLDTALAQAARWRAAGHQMTISVNVSPRQLAEADVVALVERALRRSGLPAAALCLEITETAVLPHPERAGRTLEALKRLGVQVAIDDFGQGFSSLSHLKTLPVDVIKVDRMFVDGLRSQGSDDRAIVLAVLALAEEMGLSVVAEGVEDEHQAVALRDLGCPLAQGYWFGRPAPAEAVPLGGFSARAQPGIGDPMVIREFMRQIGIPVRIQ